MQESVGAAAAVACRKLIKFSFTRGLLGYPAICLYDSVVVHCPCNERHIWLKALELFMFKSNGWKYRDRILRYPVDAELNAGWSTKPDKEFHDRLQDSAWEPTPDHLKNIENWLDAQLKLFTIAPALSVQNTRVYGH